jgi:hypothetical protein
MKKHTPEPWGVGYYDGSGTPEFIVADNEPVAVTAWGCDCCKDTPSEQDAANALRIVACVNAMQGIADPAAFVKAVDELREAATDARNLIHWLTETFTQQTPYRVPPVVERLVAAIEAVKPKPTPAPTDGERTSTVTD